MTEHDFRVKDTARGSRLREKKNRKKKKKQEGKKEIEFSKIHRVPLPSEISHFLRDIPRNGRPPFPASISFALSHDPLLSRAQSAKQPAFFPPIDRLSRPRPVSK